MNVLGLGTAIPPHAVGQAEALAMTSELVCRDDRQRRLLRVMFRQAGVERRHTVLPYSVGYDWAAAGRDSGESRGPTTAERMRFYSELGPELAREAGANALQDARVEPADVTHLVTVSCTGFEAPGVDLGLMRDLALRPTVERVHVGFMGCHAAINGLRVARAVTVADPRAVVLLCAVECCSLHYRMSWETEGMIGNALFSDGAAATVIASERRTERPGWRVHATGSCLLPDTADAMSWTIGDHGFEMRLTPRVAEAIERHLAPWLDSWLDRQGLGREAIAHWGVHPGGPRILDAVEAALELPREATASSRRVLAECGNMSSPTVLFVLDRFSPASGPALLLAFGPGLVAEAALLVPVP